MIPNSYLPSASSIAPIVAAKRMVPWVSGIEKIHCISFIGKSVKIYNFPRIIRKLPELSVII